MVLATNNRARRMARCPAQGRRGTLEVEVSKDELDEARAANSVDQVALVLHLVSQ